MKLSTANRASIGRRAGLLAVVIGMLAMAAVACTSDPDPTATPSGSGQGPNTNVGLNTGVPSIGGVERSDASFNQVNYPTSSYVPTPYYDASSNQVGIWVTGFGALDVPSDVAKVYLGVESKEETVSEARQNAAEAMTAVLDAIKDLGVSEDDIVTTSFNIYPQTVWVEVNDSLGRHSEPRITGYTVNNTVEVTVRDIDLLDEVIDQAAERGGDLIRVNSVSFTVGDPAAHGEATRRMAAQDARAKAQLYADAMGVNLGPLVFLTEVGSSAPLAQTRGVSADAAYAEEGFIQTPIQSGDVSLSTTIQAAFAIVP